MTAAAPQPQTTITRDEFSDILQELVDRGVRPTRDQTLSGLTLRNTEEAIEAINALQIASIRLTYPEDWVLFRAKDGAEICYLQDAGCERVRPLWGIDFDRVSLKEDVDDRMLEDGNYVAEAIIRCRCALTGETIEEMGFRSSAGFFGPEWEKVTKAESAVEIARLKANIRKASIVNGKGRCIRTVSGLAQVPVSKLRECGLDVKRIRGGAVFQSGTKGGSGDYASEPQLKALTAEAMKKVVGLDKIGDYGAILRMLTAANLSKRRASELIDGFKKRTDTDEPIEIATFEKMTGATFVEKGGE